MRLLKKKGTECLKDGNVGRAAIQGRRERRKKRKCDAGARAQPASACFILNGRIGAGKLTEKRSLSERRRQKKRGENPRSMAEKRKK